MRNLSFIKLAGLIFILWFVLSVFFLILLLKVEPLRFVVCVPLECFAFPITDSGSIQWIILKLFLNALGHGVVFAGFYKIISSCIPNKHKRKVIWLTVGTYCLLAYIFMWPPVVTFTHRRADTSYSPCKKNLAYIDAAINQWAIEHHKREGDAVTFNDLTPYIKLNNLGQIPPYPNDGTYLVSRVGQTPTCSLGTATNIPNKRIRVGFFQWEWQRWNDSYSHRLP